MLLNHSRFLSWESAVYLCIPFLIGLFDSLESNLLNSLYILDISPLSDVGFIKVFSQSVGCCFVLLSVSFPLQKLCNFMRSHLLILDLTAKAIVDLFRNFFPVSISLRVFPTFSLCFSVSGFMWSSLIHLDFIFVQEDKNGLICILLMITTGCGSTICWKCSLFSTGWF